MNNIIEEIKPQPMLVISAALHANGQLDLNMGGTHLQDHLRLRGFLDMLKDFCLEQAQKMQTQSGLLVPPPGSRINGVG